MKRAVFLLILALAQFLAVSPGLCQGWTPEPPVAVMPQAGFPSCTPMPPCGPMPCDPPKSGSIGALVGWQFGQKAGGLKLSTRGQPLVDKTGTQFDFDLDGVWAGVSGRLEPSCGWSARAEWRHFFPSKTHVEGNFAYAPATQTTRRNFRRGDFCWDILDASLGLNVACGAAILGGVRLDAFGASLGHAPIIYGLSSPEDEGDLGLTSVQPYGGAEFAWTGCNGGILLKVIASPWISTSVKYGMTCGNGGYAAAGTVRDHISVSSKFAHFVEASLYAGKKVSKEATASAFGMITSLSAHTDGDVKSTRFGGTDATHPNLDIAVPCDIDLTRWTIILGGNLALAF